MATFLDQRHRRRAVLLGFAGMAGLLSTGARAAKNGPAPSIKTVYTGETINGKKVVSSLDIADLVPGQKHELYFRGVQMSGGQHWYVSVIVAKGVRPGKRFTFTSGVHGDEMSSISTVQAVMRSLDPTQMAGSVMAVLDVSRPAIEGMLRRWPNSGRGIGMVDMNREWPGNENGATATSRHAGLLFNRLLRPNSDLAMDFHTGTTGLAAAALNIGDRRIPDVKTMMDLFPVGMIWDDPIYPGVLQNAFVDVGIPCFTPEVGAARSRDADSIAQFVEGTTNVLKSYGVIPGTIGRTAGDVGVYIGKYALPIIATAGGFVEFQVKLDDRVMPGQVIAIQRDTFGAVVAEYKSSVEGKVGAARTDALSDPGNVLAFVLFNGPPKAGELSAATDKDPYPE
jgi:predicted deacylase